MTKTNADLGARLHELTVKELVDVLENGMEVMDKDGDIHRIRPSATMLNTIRQFLKDSGIGFADDANTDDNINKLQKSLPKFEDDDFGQEVQH